MKIAFVAQPWDRIIPPVEQGSTDLWIYEVARRLAASCEVVVYARAVADRPKREWVEGVQYRRISVGTDHSLFSVPRGFLRRYKRVITPMRRLAFPISDRPFFAAMSFYWTYIAQVANDLRAQKSDLVHIINFSHFAPVIKLFNPRVKTALHMHCEWLSQFSPAMVERRLRKVDLVIGCSNYIARECSEAFPQFSGRCRSVWNGVDVDQFCPSPAEDKRWNHSKRLLFVGRVSPEKGLHVLLEAFEKVVSRHPDAFLDIVGPDVAGPLDYITAASRDSVVKRLTSSYDETYRHQLMAKASKAIAGRVCFTGEVPHSRIIDRYRSADVFVFPSVCNEAFGMPLIEAMASGLPVVATRVGGIGEVVDHAKTGLLVDRNDASALADAILLLLEREELRTSMGKAARKRAVELFSWERVVERLCLEYRNIAINVADCSRVPLPEPGCDAAACPDLKG